MMRRDSAPPNLRGGRHGQRHPTEAAGRPHRPARVLN
jgi:hypothetical protein